MRATLSAEKIFQRESWAFQLVLWALLMILYGVLASVCSCFVVRFNIVCGAVLHGLWCALGMLCAVCGMLGLVVGDGFLCVCWQLCVASLVSWLYGV
jgi:hypothetical protein